MKLFFNLTHVLLLFIAIIAMPVEVFSQQSRTVSGIVLDEKDDPAIGVSVIVQGTSVGTITDIAGKFQLAMPAGSSVLQISYLGYQTQTVSPGSQTQLTIKLKEESKILDELVVIGYGTVKRRDLTGAVSSVKREDIIARPGPNPMQSLQGRVAGLDITRTSGQAGAGVDIQLRGVRSFKASGTPLILIDGLPGDSIYATLNANDIESVEVLKDASSTAIYGSAGANGVIIITTKNGSSGKLNIDLNAYFGYNGWSIVPEMRTRDSYVQAKRDAYSYIWDKETLQWTKTGALWQSPEDDANIFGEQRYRLYQEGRWTDWTGLFMRTNAITQNYSLSVSGGSEKTRGYISFNYTDELGQYYGDDYKLYSTNMRLEHSPYKWLTIGSNLQGSYTVRNGAQDKLENALTTDPLVRPYDENGELVKELGNNVYNLLFNYQPGVYSNLYHNARVNVNPFVEIKPIKGLSYISKWGIWLTNNNRYRFEGIGSVNEQYTHVNNAIAQINQNRTYGYQWDNILTYNFTLNQDHNFTLTGVTSWYDNQNMNSWLKQDNVASNSFKWYDIKGKENIDATTNYNMMKTMGYIGRIHYSYLGKYLVSASARHDGASVLYRTNRWNTFPAVAVAWRISEENFMNSAKNWLDDLKLRIGRGVTGSAKIEAYSSVNTLESLSLSLGGRTQASYRNSQEITNPDLGWEKSYNTNIGLDAMLIKNRVRITMDYYLTNTKGVIWDVSLPAIYGLYNSNGTQFKTYMNLAETKTNGFEMVLNTRNIVTKDFEWNSNIVFSTAKEEILKLTGATNNFISKGDTDYTLALGEPVNSFWNYKIDGVWQIGQEKDAAVFGRRPGDLNVNIPNMVRLEEGVFVKTADDGTKTYYYTDLALAKKYNPELTDERKIYTYSERTDWQILGNNSPKWMFGFQNEFRYKNFDLTVYAFMRWGQMINYSMLGWYQPNGFATNASPSRTFPTHFNYWTPTNPSNDFPVMNYEESITTQRGSGGLNYTDGSFFKLKNITLGYTLPKSIGSKVYLDRFRIYGTITNPLIIAKNPLLKNYDPEMNGSLDYPLTRQIVVGFNLTF